MSSYYISVLLLYKCPLCRRSIVMRSSYLCSKVYMCPLTIYVSSYYISVLLLYVSSYFSESDISGKRREACVECTLLRQYFSTDLLHKYFNYFPTHKHLNSFTTTGGKRPFERAQRGVCSVCPPLHRYVCIMRELAHEH